MEDKESEQNLRNENIPIVTTHDGKRVLIQLEGSHTTSTATESALGAEKKNVKFKDEKETEDNEILQSKEEILSEEAAGGEANLKQAIFSAATKANEQTQLTAHLEASISITGFGKLNNFSTNDFTKPNSKIENVEFKILNQGIDERASQTRLVYTPICTCRLTNISCQTQITDLISLNDSSALEVSSLTSRSEQPNSLNNYAQAENACVIFNGPQQKIIKQPLVDTLLQENLTSPLEEPTITPDFNIIPIQDNSTQSSAALRRPPFCHRIWSALCNFFAVTFLCLQVNRDCIFCLGFFAAFVVSASFLTAFFYHTLVMSPVLSQNPMF